MASFAGYAKKASPACSEFHICAGLATLMLVTCFLFCGQASAAGDAAAGKTVFANQCSSCHTTEVGKNGFGPSLAGVAYASKDYTGQRFVDLSQINPRNAGQLRAACIYRSNNAGATQTNPLVYKGVMYLTIDKAIVAIDAATCRERW